MNRRVPALALSSLALGCDEPRASFDLDALVEPAKECVTVVHESLDLGGSLHRFVGDGIGSQGGWGLVTLDGVLVIVRVPASEDEPSIAPIQLGLPDEYADIVELRAGLDGELWVLLDAGNASVRRMLPGFGEVGRNDSLENFPGIETSDSCPTDYARSMLLIAGQPYVIALPDCADGPALSLHLLELERETLEFVTAWQLIFDPCDDFADPAACALVHLYSLESIGPPRSSPHATLERVAIAFTQVRIFEGLWDAGTGDFLRSADVSLLDMRMTESGPSARLVSYRDVWTSSLPFLLGPVDVTRDPYSTQLHVRNVLLEDDSVLIRLDTIAEHYSLLTTAEQLPLAGRGRLVQLTDSGAMIDVEEGALRAVGLRDWPHWMRHTLLELDDLVDFEVGGIGQLLLRREQSPPQVVHIECLK